MAKFTDAWRVALQNYFNAGDQPTEAQFTQLMLSIQQGIEEHDHDGTGDGDGIASIGITGITGAGVDVPTGWYLGIGAALERLVFDAAGDICVMGAKFGVGTLTPHRGIEVTTDFVVGNATDGVTIWYEAGLGTVAGIDPTSAGYNNLALRVGVAGTGWYLRTDGNIGSGTVEPGDNIAGGASDYTGKVLHLKGASVVRQVVEGDYPLFEMVDLGGAANDKILTLYVDGGSGYFMSRDDDLTTRKASILVMDMGTGAIQFGQYGAGDLQTDAAGNVTAVSDARLKTDIEPIKIGLAEVLQLQGKRWHYTKESGLDTEHWYQGFIADDVEKIVPGAVGQMQDGMKTLSTNSLIPALVGAIQELDARLTNGGL